MIATGNHGRMIPPTPPASLNAAYRIMVLTAGLLSLWTSATAETASPGLLLPYFEVSLESGKTTLFEVKNSESSTVDMEVVIFSNWGIQVLRRTLSLAPAQVRTIDLADWILRGSFPSGDLSREELAHLQAALSGRPSPKTQRFYGSEIKPGLAVGYVQVHVRDGDSSASLRGGYAIAEATSRTGVTENLAATELSALPTWK